MLVPFDFLNGSISLHFLSAVLTEDVFLIKINEPRYSPLTLYGSLSMETSIFQSKRDKKPL